MKLTLAEALSKGVKAHEAGNLKQAYRIYTAILQAQHKFNSTHRKELAACHYNTGNIERLQGNLKDAISNYKRAIKHDPAFIDAYLSLGVTLEETGAPRLAIKYYHEATELAPNHAVAHFNLGNSQLALGNKNDAVRSYRKSVSLQPDFVNAHNNLGIALIQVQDIAGAIDSYHHAINCLSDPAEAYYNLGSALNYYVFTKPRPYLKKTIMGLLTDGHFCRPIEISKAILSLLRLEPELAKILNQYTPRLLAPENDRLVLKLAKEELLIKLMSISGIPDLKFEALLVSIRANLLFGLSEIKESERLLEFQSALALQCFFNEYLYPTEEDEREALNLLEEEVSSNLLEGQQPIPSKILCLASYKPLYKCDWHEYIKLVPSLKAVIQRQVEEPITETQLKEKIPTLKSISHRVSFRVRDQYEEDPYPRWVNIALNSRPRSIANLLGSYNLCVNNQSIFDVDAPEILVAGCGTGQHPITTACRYKDSQILAIDLSITSLAHALRKTEELGLTNIKYMQADILDVENLERRFDVVESVGVLHHMQDPLLGWKRLTECLKPAGLMRIGLYSELARQDIVKIRNEIKLLKVGSGREDLQAFRGTLINSDKEHHKRVTESTDFYNLSSMRDLLFHVQEHRFTITQIKDYLLELGLHFCGFEGTHLLQAFQATYVNEKELHDLDKWEEFESENPYIFGGMYQFWCQKK